MKMSSIFVGLLFSVAALAAKVEVEVKGMTCGMCIESITKELKATEKTDNISVSLEENKARFTELKDKRISDHEIKSAIKKAGYEATKIRRY
jgi:copper chaperone CopZ